MTLAIDDISVTDLTSWQRRASSALDLLIKDGHKALRYPLQWTITSNGSLIGTVDPYRPGQSDEDRRTIFNEWHHALKARQVSEFKQPGGGVALSTVFTQPTNRGDVQGTLILAIAPLLDDETS